MKNNLDKTPEEKKSTKSSDYEYGTVDYYHRRVVELEKVRDRNEEVAKYYKDELEKAHAMVGRVVMQNSERWDTLRITGSFPTDNKHNWRSSINPKGLSPKDLEEFNKR
tara:strand:+ start:898 stop:1224 length:327 start_codon:yes stop_codon:yes gene_type:complete